MSTGISLDVAPAREALTAAKGLLDSAGSKAVRDVLAEKLAVARNTIPTAEWQAELDALLALLPDAGNPAVRQVMAGRIDALLAALSQEVNTSISVPGANVNMQAGATGMNITINVTEPMMDGAEPLAPARPPVPVAPAAPRCDTSGFSTVAKAVEAEAFPDGKLSTIREAAGNRCFTSAQVKTLLEELDFGSDKVEAAVLLYPAVDDKQNWLVVYEAFDFSSDKDEVRKRLGL